MSASSLRDQLVADAADIGFHRVGIVPVEEPRRYQAYRDWLDSHMHGEMAYMAAPDHVAGRADPRRLLASARTLVVVALAYDPGTSAGIRPGRAGIARYARGRDYHQVMKGMLSQLAERLRRAADAPVAARACVDSAPVLERDAGDRAGIGFVAKNTMLISPGLGSYTLLGELLLDIELPATSKEPASKRCGQCRACLDACPTGAFRDAYVLDARRCISYLTIEHKGPIPLELRAKMGTMIFGCDICQEVCPFNARAPHRVAPSEELSPLSPDHAEPDLIALATMSGNQRKRFVAGTPMRRASRDMWMRNIAVALGNSGLAAAREPLQKLANEDKSELVREHARWALEQLGRG